MRAFAILPAAGRSTRMGRPKLLLPWGESTLIEHLLRAWRESGVERTVIVLHPDDDQLASTCRRAGVDVVVAQSPPPEMKASVRLGLSYVAAQFAPGDESCWLLAPADMPNLRAASIQRVLAERVPGKDEILVPTHAGRRGHPVLFPWRLRADVEALGDHQGLNQLLRVHRVREVPCEEEDVLVDIDTPDDYERRRANLPGGP